MNWIDIIKALANLDPETRGKVLDIIKQIVTLLEDPAFRDFIAKFAPKA